MSTACQVSCSKHVAPAGNPGLTSQTGSCSTQSRCSAPDEEGQADGLACSSDHNCQEGSTCVDYICQAASQSSASHSPQPSASSAPRSGSSHGAPYKRHAMLNHVELARAIVGSKSKRASTSCPSGYTLCPSGTGDGDSDFGYEVRKYSICILCWASGRSTSDVAVCGYQHLRQLVWWLPAHAGLRWRD